MVLEVPRQDQAVNKGQLLLDSDLGNLARGMGLYLLLRGRLF